LFDTILTVLNNTEKHPVLPNITAT